MSSTPSRRALLLAVGAAGLGGLTACTPDAAGGAAAPGAPPRSPSGPPAAPATVVLTADGAPTGAGGAGGAAGAAAVLGPRPRLAVQVTGGDLSGVAVTGPDGTAVPGTTADGAWTPTAPLVLGAAYTATATARNADRAAATGSLAFRVVGEDRAVRAKLQPLDGEVVGVGMPVVVTLTAAVPVEQRRALTDAMTVDAGGVEGAWRWIGADTVHWRPREYWPAGTRVRVRVPMTQLQLGAGRWGAQDRDVSFTVGDAHVSRADTDTHQMTTSVNGQVVRVIPISAGREGADPHFVTRSGPHVVTEKHADHVMDGATVGLDYTTPVKWATRIADSGEFVHGAPWSVPSQGHANVSHGCLNASDDDAHWFYDLSRRGDVVEVTGTARPLELTNGLGDWTLSWEQWTSA